MRILMSLLLLGLFCSIQLTSSAPNALEARSSCCFQFYKKKIPLNLVVSFYRTRSNCPISAIVEFCVDPNTDENRSTSDPDVKVQFKIVRVVVLSIWPKFEPKPLL
uniref:Chemokine (C-C motif) ligand 39, duplicate 1 n=1 Tax=Sinocyclocheilus rhinocerous TaxID=307959 RepID=A0A673G2K5_9TELE